VYPIVSMVVSHGKSDSLLYYTNSKFNAVNDTSKVLCCDSFQTFWKLLRTSIESFGLLIQESKRDYNSARTTKSEVTTDYRIC